MTYDKYTVCTSYCFEMCSGACLPQKRTRKAR